MRNITLIARYHLLAGLRIFVLLGLVNPLVYAHTTMRSNDTNETHSPLDGNGATANTCRGCHSATTLTTQSASVTFSGISGTTYTPGTLYNLTLSVTASASGRQGFEITAENATAKAGTFSLAAGSANTVLVGTPATWVAHTNAASGNQPWHFTWTAST